MTFWKRLIGRGEPPKRIHVCVECGMPVHDHKPWCSILRGQREIDARRAAQETSRG
ncbi:MAG: hypothetical protein HYU53_01915 [Acidobacteria bacterium]|nr:hypothetical protein [Acidobacteriota bacterium]